MKKIISALLILTMLCSMVCVSASAEGSIIINENFQSEEALTGIFRLGKYYVNEPGVLVGYSEAKSFQTEYSDPEGFFDNTLYTWLTYDATVTLTIGEDEYANGEDRTYSLVYCNDNPRYNALSDKRDYTNFVYDIVNEQFCFSHGNIATLEAEAQLLPPVARSIDVEKPFTMGISVDKNRIRCFYNGELIFDFQDTSLMIADSRNSPFLTWNVNNLIQMTNVTIATQGTLFPYPVNDVTTTGTTTAGGDNNVTTTPRVTTTAISNVAVTDAEGNAVTDAEGNAVTETVIVTDAPVADTNTGAVSGGASTSTGDTSFIVAVAMVAALGCALIVKKVSVK